MNFLEAGLIPRTAYLFELGGHKDRISVISVELGLRGFNI